MHLSLNLLGVLFILALEGVKSEYNIFAGYKTLKKKQNAEETTSARQIIGGEEAIPGRYPYMAGLLADCDSNIPICGGTLIAPQWVLSAAHCYSYIPRVDIGRHDRSNSTEIYETIDVDFAVLHPQYSQYGYAHDLMLLRLKEPSKNTPIALRSPLEDLPPKSKTTVMGWGITSTDFISITDVQTDVLLEVEVDIISNELCNSASAYAGVVTDDMICAGSPGKDSCAGDSGGPLFIKGENATMDSQVGIVTWGYGCAEPLYPGVYSSVADASDFIEYSMSCNATDFDDDCCEARCVNGVYICISSTCTSYPCNTFPEDGFDYSNCDIDYPYYISDGFCDTMGPYNTAECNYDGGDCCEDTCLAGPYYYCGPCFDCKDPNSEYSNGGIGGTVSLLFAYVSIITDATINLIGDITTTILT